MIRRRAETIASGLYDAQMDTAQQVSHSSSWLASYKSTQEAKLKNKLYKLVSKRSILKFPPNWQPKFSKKMLLDMGDILTHFIFFFKNISNHICKLEFSFFFFEILTLLKTD